jgi:signal transduction histidine kinase
VFERFHRGANVGRQIAGVGLGLAGVKHIVEQHEGSIAIASEDGRGTTVTLRLPL